MRLSVASVGRWATDFATVRRYLHMSVSGAGSLRRGAHPCVRAHVVWRVRQHHDHLIDVETGKVVEFVDPELEALQKQIAEKLGYRLVDHRMELYGVRIDRDD